MRFPVESGDLVFHKVDPARCMQFYWNNFNCIDAVVCNICIHLSISDQVIFTSLLKTLIALASCCSGNSVLETHPEVPMSSAPSSSHEIDTSKDNIYSTSILIANLPSPANYHGLESAIRNATRSTNDRLVIILYSPGFASQEDSRANWFEVQKILTWTYVESTAMAQEMDKVLLDTDVLLRTQYKLAAEGSTEDEELVKRVDALYVFESGAS